MKPLESLQMWGATGGRDDARQRGVKRRSPLVWGPLDTRCFMLHSVFITPHASELIVLWRRDTENQHNWVILTVDAHLSIEPVEKTASPCLRLIDLIIIKQQLHQYICIHACFYPEAEQRQYVKETTVFVMHNRFRRWRLAMNQQWKASFFETSVILMLILL